MIIVSDASPLMNLSAINHLHLLHDLYGEIFIPPNVFNELTINGKGQPGDSEVRNVNWIQVKKAVNIVLVSELSKEIDPGEAEAIALAIELRCDKLIIDERLGRKVAQEYHLRVIGTLGILLQAINLHLISSVCYLMDLLRDVAHFWITDELYEEIKQIAVE